MNKGQIIIILLLLANLAATLWFGLQRPPQANTELHNVAAPEALNAEVQTQLLEQFRQAFNRQDYDGIYNMLGPLAQTKVPRDKVETEFRKLIRYFKSIESGAFSHLETLDNQGNTKLYVLNYSVRLSAQSEFGQEGQLRMTVLLRDGQVEVYGIRLTSG